MSAWKSPIAQPLIDAWNLVGPLPIARVIDWTDLLALLALPLALVYSRSKYRVLPTAIIRTAMLGLAAGRRHRHVEGATTHGTRLALCRRFAPEKRDQWIAAFEREVLAHLSDVRRVDPGRSP